MDSVSSVVREWTTASTESTERETDPVDSVNSVVNDDYGNYGVHRGLGQPGITGC